VQPCTKREKKSCYSTEKHEKKKVGVNARPEMIAEERCEEKTKKKEREKHEKAGLS